MSVIDQLSSSLGRRDEVPNQELARQLAGAENRKGITEIATNLWSKDKAIQADCLKVLYEIGYLKPELIAPYAADFVKLLQNRNNRLVWGGMIAIAAISRIAAAALFPHREAIQKAMDTGSVITRDAGIWALSDIAAANPKYNAALFPYLLDHLRTCRPKDVPQHAERVVAAVNVTNKDEFLHVIENRSKNMSVTQLKRLKQVSKLARAKED